MSPTKRRVRFAAFFLQGNRKTPPIARRPVRNKPPNPIKRVRVSLIQPTGANEQNEIYTCSAHGGRRAGGDRRATWSGRSGGSSRRTRSPSPRPSSSASASPSSRRGRLRLAPRTWGSPTAGSLARAPGTQRPQIDLRAHTERGIRNQKSNRKYKTPPNRRENRIWRRGGTNISARSSSPRGGKEEPGLVRGNPSFSPRRARDWVGEGAERRWPERKARRGMGCEAVRCFYSWSHRSRGQYRALEPAPWLGLASNSFFLATTGKPTPTHWWVSSMTSGPNIVRSHEFTSGWVRRWVTLEEAKELARTAVCGPRAGGHVIAEHFLEWSGLGFRPFLIRPSRRRPRKIFLQGISLSEVLTIPFFV